YKRQASGRSSARTVATRGACAIAKSAIFPMPLLLLIPLLLASALPCAAVDYYGVVSRGTTAVAVGDSGTILYSPQAPHRAWFAAATHVVEKLRAATTGATDYVVVGDRGRLLRSITGDGVGWLPRVSGTLVDLFGVSHARERLVAVGAGGIILRTPTQGLGDWERLDSLATSRDLRAVTSNESYAIAVGDSGTILWATIVSTQSWSSAAQVPTDRDLFGVAGGPGATPGRFWAVGDGGTILRSLPNPQTWEAIPSGTTRALRAVTFFGNFGVAVGDEGTILYSNGGSSWTAVDSGTTQNLRGVAYTGSGEGGGFVAVGDGGTILWSALGLAWEAAVVPTQATTWGTLRGRWSGSPGR
ncbi:MAG: hypothetical protein QUU85_07905, partial [Candidatus Eisenbacteria bacterium]|nr:hypothetical protein [Candidatus Eisenbacteria bacterium]